MNKYLVAALFIFLAAKGHGQEIKISYKALPAVVLQAFRDSYPGARIKGATKEINKGDTYYEVACKDGATERTISFNADGKIVEREEDITVDKLPDPVANAITKQYTKGKIMKIELSVKDSKTVYEVQIKEKKKKFEVEFLPDGTVVGTK